MDYNINFAYVTSAKEKNKIFELNFNNIYKNEYIYQTIYLTFILTCTIKT